MKKYSSIFLDLDNTILDFNLSETMAIRTVLAAHGLPSDEDTVKLYSNINRNLWEKFERSEIKKNDIFVRRFIELFEILGSKADPEQMSKDYCFALSNGFDLVEGAIEILEYLKASGYKLYATTNGLASTQYKRITGSGIEKYFDGIFVSESSGYQKPEKEYFDYVMNNIEENDKSKILVIGDSQSSDILGGINAGLDTCFFNRYGIVPVYKSEFEAETLCGFKDFL